ncbi:MAG TPA: pilus assembly protein TadG-related protein [Rhodoglobus sp.]|nr:pilus assembly protein TadG-related protein [Rhodoglobus sp.]
MRRLRDDDGSMLPLTIFFGFLSLVLVLLVVAATSLYLERKRLFTLADGAALVGAEAFELADVTATPDGVRAQLRSGDVAAAVADYVAQHPADFDALAIRHAGSDDRRSATVTLSAIWHPPILSPLVPAGVPIEVTAVARSVFS